MNQHAISELSFLKPPFFGTMQLFFQFEAPSTFSRNEHRGLLRVSALCDIFRRKKSEYLKKVFCFQRKWFLRLIEHERHPLGDWKLFSDLFINTSWAYFKNLALFEPTLDAPVLFVQKFLSKLEREYLRNPSEECSRL